MAMSDDITTTLRQLRLFGCLARIDELRNEPWLARVVEIERADRTRRRLAHWTHVAGIGTFKPLCDFDWKWPKKMGAALSRPSLNPSK